MMAAIRHVLTGRDNETFAHARVLAAVGVAWYLVLGAWAVLVRGQPFDPQAFGIGLGAALAAGGFAVQTTGAGEPFRDQEPPR